MKSLKYGLAALAVALAGVVAPATNTFAEETNSSSSVNSSSWIQVTPVSSRVVLRPGQELEYSMVVANIGTDKFNYSVYAAPYSVIDEDYNVSFSNETNRTQLARWIKFIKEDGTTTDTYKGSLEPNEKHTVNYQISVPEDVPAGGQYATIFAQTDNDNTNKDTSGITTVSRIGLIVYGRTNGETNEKAEITDWSVSGLLNQGPITATSKVKNEGNTDIEAKYKFTVRSIFGNTLHEDEQAYNILPDTERRLNSEWGSNTPMGLFWVTYNVSSSALENAREETKLVVILPIYMIVIMLILLTILIIWIIMLSRKRKERKGRLKV